RLILSNSSKARGSNEWDEENAKFRDELIHTAGLTLSNRMFNNGHIGHNKFAVFVDGSGKPQAVMTGSTNWTPTGLCGQSNNAVIIESPEVAQQFLDCWELLQEDTGLFTVPNPLSKATPNVQGPKLRAANATPPTE